LQEFLEHNKIKSIDHFIIKLELDGMDKDALDYIINQ